MATPPTPGGLRFHCQPPKFAAQGLQSHPESWRADGRTALPRFFIAEALMVFAFSASAYLLGAMVRRRNWNPNFTRKALAAAMLVAPVAIGLFIFDAPDPLPMAASFALLFLLLTLFSEPMRRRFGLVETAFASIDRSEDRPFTLAWFLSGYAASAILLLIMMWWAVPDQPAYVFIALVAVAVGDFLANVIGRRFGRYRYRSPALFAPRSYTRSLEGSVCVAAATIAAIFLVRPSLPAEQFWPALALMPGALALAEAKSPHAWDEPVMLAAATLAALAIVKVVGGC